MKTKITVRILALALLLCLMGCTNPGVSEASSDTVIKATEENLKSDSDDSEVAKAPVHEFSEEDYVQKNTAPVIRIDTFGYKNHDVKTAFFTKGKVGDIFYVVNADSRERVYQGKLEEKRKGDFSAVTKEGTYYIEAAHIGRSAVFSVKRDRYKDSFSELQKRVLAYANKEDVEFEEKVLIWNRLLQYYRDDYAGSQKAAGITAESEEIQLLETTAKALMSEADTYRSNTTAYIEELAVYSASMAIFYQTVKTYDEAAAVTYLAEAEDTYIQVEHEKAMLLDEAYLFYPAAALYCATGKAPYESAAENYLKEHTGRDFFEEDASEQALTADEMYLFGIMAYLNTTYKVDMNLCESLMQNLSTKAELFADVSKYENHFRVANDFRNRLLADRLYVIAIVENVIVSKEYTNIVKNGIHYLGGCNETGSAYYSEYGVYDAKSDEKSNEAFLGSAYLNVLDKVE